MRNLNLIYKKKIKIPYDDLKTFVIDSSFDGDSMNTTFICTSKNIISVNCENSDIKEIIELDTNRRIIGFECLILDRELCYAYEDGEVWSYEFRTNNSNVVTFCEDGIEGMSWSPDQETVVFVTRYVIFSLPKIYISNQFLLYLEHVLWLF